MSYNKQVCTFAVFTITKIESRLVKYTNKVFNQHLDSLNTVLGTHKLPTTRTINHRRTEEKHTIHVEWTFTHVMRYAVCGN